MKVQYEFRGKSKSKREAGGGKPYQIAATDEHNPYILLRRHQSIGPLFGIDHFYSMAHSKKGAEIHIHNWRDV